jgi:hypothetical protein
MAQEGKATLISEPITDNSILPVDIYALRTAMGVVAYARHYYRGDGHGLNLEDQANNVDLKLPGNLNSRPAYGVISKYGMGRVMHGHRDKGEVLQTDKGALTATQDITKSFAVYWLGAVRQFNNSCQFFMPMRHSFGPGWEIGIAGPRRIGACALDHELYFSIGDNISPVKSRVQSVDTENTILSILGVFNATANTIQVFTNLGTGNLQAEVITTLVPLEPWSLTMLNFGKLDSSFGPGEPAEGSAQDAEFKMAAIWEDPDVETWNQATHDTLFTALGLS